MRETGRRAVRLSGGQLPPCFGFRGSSGTRGLLASALNLDCQLACAALASVGLSVVWAGSSLYVNKFKMICCCAEGYPSRVEVAWAILV